MHEKALLHTVCKFDFLLPRVTESYDLSILGATDIIVLDTV